MGSRTDECAEDLVPTLFVHPCARNRVVHISSFDLSFCPALLMATTLIFPTGLQPAPALASCISPFLYKYQLCLTCPSLPPCPVPTIQGFNITIIQY